MLGSRMGSCGRLWWWWRQALAGAAAPSGCRLMLAGSVKLGAAFMPMLGLSAVVFPTLVSGVAAALGDTGGPLSAALGGGSDTPKGGLHHLG